MDKLLEMLNVQKLDEKEQEAVKEKLETLIELKAKEAVDEQLKTEKEKLIEQYEEKFEAYKEDITSKFSNFVDEILDEQMQIPEKVLEYARKGELYSDLIEQFKVRLGVDEGLLDEEVKSLLKEAKEEIVTLRDELNKTMSEKLETQSDAQELAAELYLRRKTDGLTESQKTHVFSILEGVTDRSEIDRKFDIIVEQYKEEDDDDEDEDDKKKKGKKDMKDDDEDDDDDDKNESKNEDGKTLNEEVSPFEQRMKDYVQVLRNRKI